MLARLRMLWAAVRDSLWFIPATMTLAAAVLAYVVVQLDTSFDWTLLRSGHWLIAGTIEGSRAVLSTITASLITVTGVVFSVTIVALQLASSQFTPRILRNFMADRSNQIVLGVFIATFTYTLLVLRTARSTRDGGESVPQLSVSLAMVLALVSIGFLIHFVHHTARSIQASVILNGVTADALAQVKRLFPQEIGEAESCAPPMEDVLPASEPEVVLAEVEGYLQAVDANSLFRQGEQGRMLIKMTQPVGSFIVTGMALAQVWAEGRLPEGARRSIRSAFVIGSERTPEQDLEFFLIEIADMAVKALSPGINDPTTAEHCIDRLTQILLSLGKRRPPAPMRTESGEAHFVAQPMTFDRALEVSFGQVLHFGRDKPAIVNKLRRSIHSLVKLLPPERHGALRAFPAKLEQAGAP